MSPEEIAALKAAAYDADTQTDWFAQGNTLYFGKHDGDYVAIPGGVTLVRFFAAAQPRVVLALIRALEEDWGT